ncbi:MAG: transcription termination/antitermination NusG family protein [Opitutae bacterium]|jgi:transcriptional antiterminator RfaH
MSETAENFWFCLKSKPRQEAVAVRNLRAVGEIEIFFPRIRRTRRGHEKNKEVIEPLFPGYIFVKFNPEDSQGTVKSTRGVLHLVSKGGKAVDVENKVIEELKALGPEGILSMLDEELKVGAKIKVIRGIFAGSEGEVLKLATPQKRIAVLLTLLGAQQSVEMPMDDVTQSEDEVS